MATTYIGEVFEQSNKLSGKAEVYTLLKKHHTAGLQMLLFLAYSGKITWLLPPGAPPYRPDPSPYGSHSRSLISEAGRLRQYVQCNDMIPNAVRREAAFISMLECLHAKEAEIVLAVKEGTLSTLYKFIDADMAHHLYPSIIPQPYPEGSARPLAATDVGGQKTSEPSSVDSAKPASTESVSEQPTKKKRGRPFGIKNGEGRRNKKAKNETVNA